MRVVSGMMTMTNMLYARAGAAAIAAALALSPTHAAAPKPIVDLSKSPALSGDKAATAPGQSAADANQRQMIELGGGAVALLVLGGAALAISRRKRRREEESWHFEPTEPVAEEAPPSEEPMTLTQEAAEPQPAMVAPPMPAFDWDKQPPAESAESDCEDLESWTERAKCGPTEDNPSQSLKKRMKRAAFFEKREREVAAGEAAPIDPDAGLPEAMVDEQEQERA
jgi:resuscitation-promoting factor RpfA